MIKHTWTVICQKSIIDKETNNISLDVLEQLGIKTSFFPKETKGIIFPIQIEIISLWYRAQGDQGVKGSGRLRIEAPNNEEISVINMDIDLTKTHRTRTRIRLDGLPIPKDTSGYFYFVTELESNNDWVEVSRVPLEVDVKQA